MSLSQYKICKARRSSVVLLPRSSWTGTPWSRGNSAGFSRSAPLQPVQVDPMGATRVPQTWRTRETRGMWSSHLPVSKSFRVFSGHFRVQLFYEATWSHNVLRLQGTDRPFGETGLTQPVPSRCWGHPGLFAATPKLKTRRAATRWCHMSDMSTKHPQQVNTNCNNLLEQTSQNNMSQLAPATSKEVNINMGP